MATPSANGDTPTTIDTSELRASQSVPRPSAAGAIDGRASPPGRSAATTPGPQGAETMQDDREREPRRSWLDSAITLVVALVAAAASYGHMLHVALLAGEPLWIARAWPITVDGLVLAALRRGERGRGWLALGAAVSVAANVLAQYPELAANAGPVISAWPPVALYGTHRLLHGKRRPARTDAGNDGKRAPAGNGPLPAAGPASADDGNYGDRPTTKAGKTGKTGPGGNARPAGRRGPAGGRRRASFADFSAVAAELAAEGRPVNRTSVTERLRKRGLSLANDRADDYLARLHDDQEAA